MSKLRLVHPDELRFSDTNQPIFTQETRTQEEITAEDYKRRGRQISDLIKERELLQDEIRPALQDGVRFEYNGETLCLEYQAKTTFDWERWASDNKIDMSTLKDYLDTKISEVVVFRKIQSADEIALEEHKKRCAESQELYRQERDEARKAEKGKKK